MTRFYVKVSPGQDEFHVDVSGTYPRIDLTAPPDQGRANSELVNKLTQILGESVGIVSGHASRRKKMAVDLSEDEVRERLQDVHE